MLLSLLTVAFTGQARAQDADAVLDRLRERFETTDALRARFSQTVGAQTTAGTVVLSGDRYRIETPQQTLVTDGETAWAYTARDNQVLVNDVLEDETAFSPTAFFTRYPDRYDVTLRGSESLDGVRHDVLRLRPTTDEAFVEEVTLWVRQRDALPTRIRVVDRNGTELLFELDDVEVNPPLAADTFRFTPRPGTEVVDLRS